MRFCLLQILGWTTLEPQPNYFKCVYVCVCVCVLCASVCTNLCTYATTSVHSHGTHSTRCLMRASMQLTSAVHCGIMPSCSLANKLYTKHVSSIHKTSLCQSQTNDFFISQACLFVHAQHAGRRLRQIPTPQLPPSCPLWEKAVPPLTLAAICRL